MRGRRLLTIGLLVTVSAAAFESLAVATIMPATVAEIGGLAVLRLDVQRLHAGTDRRHLRRRSAGRYRGLVAPFAAGGIAFSLGLLGAGLAPSMPALIAARVRAGLRSGCHLGARLCGGGARLPGCREAAHARAPVHGVGRARPDRSGARRRGRPARRLALGVPRPRAAHDRRRRGGVARPAAPPRPGGAQRVVRITSCAAVGARPGRRARLGGAALDIARGRTARPRRRRRRGAAESPPSPPAGTLTARAGQPAAVATAALLAAAFFGAEIFVPLALTELRGSRPPWRRAGAERGDDRMDDRCLASGTLRAAVEPAAPHRQRALRHDRRHRRHRACCSATSCRRGCDAELGAGGPGHRRRLLDRRAGRARAAPRDEEGAASAALQLAFVVGTAMGTAATGASSRVGRKTGDRSPSRSHSSSPSRALWRSSPGHRPAPAGRAWHRANAERLPIRCASGNQTIVCDPRRGRLSARRRARAPMFISYCLSSAPDRLKRQRDKP